MERSGNMPRVAATAEQELPTGIMEKYLRERCGRRTSCAACRGRCAPKEELAKRCRVSAALLTGIIYEGWITHPRIATRIVREIGGGAAEYDRLVADAHKGKYRPRAKAKPKEQPKPKERAARKCSADKRSRTVVLISKDGRELERFPSEAAAAQFAWLNHSVVRNRCRHRLKEQGNDFIKLPSTCERAGELVRFRFAEEWDNE